MVPVSKRRPLILGTLAVALMSSVVIYFVKPVAKHEPGAVDKNHSGTPSLVVSSSSDAVTTIVTTAELEQDEIIISTPSEHDQLIISPILEGTSIDGSLKADRAGNLVLDIEIKDFFDYFLSTADDIGPEQSIAEIQRYAQSYLPEPARSQALELLDNYAQYKQTEFQIHQVPITQADLNDSDALQLLRSSFEQLKSERQSLFSPEQDQALFGLEDSYAAHTLTTLEVMADDSTNDEEKRAQLRVLQSQLPTEISASFEKTQADRQRQALIETAVNSQQDDAQVYESLSEQGLAQSQIDSIVSRRQDQRAFNAAYSRYQQQKRALGERLADNAERYQAELAELQNRIFVNPSDRTQAALRDLGDQ